MPMPDPNVPESIVFDKFSGIKNTVGQESLNVGELMTAVNVDIDDVGHIRRRRGSTKVATGNFHSLFNADDGTLIGVKNNNLGIINPDYSFQTLKAGIGNVDPAAGLTPLSYVQLGDMIYYSSPADSGKIFLPTSSVLPWGAEVDNFWLSPVVNPTQNLAAIRGKLLGPPPMASAITYWNGRIYMMSGNLVWATELYLYDYVDKTRGFYSFEDECTMIGAVADGVYVGTTGGMWFLSGTHAEGLKRARVMDSPVVPGSMVYIPAELANPPQVGTAADTPMQVSISFMTSNGFCVAQDGGQCTNLTEAKVVFPTAQHAAALYRRQDGVNSYIAVTDSGGTPTTNTRIGDYVDAELIRGGRWTPVCDRIVIGDSLTATII